MYCGIVFSEDDSSESQVAFLEDELETFSVETNEEIIELVEERTPELIAVNTGLQERTELSEGEEELQEEGHIYTPAKHDTKRVRRFEAFKGLLERKLPGEDIPEFIRFEPMISGRELAVDSDSALESYGVDPSDIDSSVEFDATLGAVTARFYSQEQTEDMGVQVPEPVFETEEEVKKDPREGEGEKIPGSELQEDGTENL
ncbi:MAG: hypothetical protein ABEJ36_03500 [Candidatus Nanosalina sp.]